MKIGLVVQESKSVEEQMASALQQPEVGSGNRPIGHKSLAGVAGNNFVTEEMRRRAEYARTERERQKQMLNLQRENILGQRTSQPVRRIALEAALAQIEGQIKALD
ncbi:MAG: hypothetical protein ABSE51_07035 [Terracidiphilus sp.]|jgi:hypothetical protein